MAADLVRPHDGRVVAIRFEEVPDQAPLENAASVQSDADLAFEARADDLEAAFGVPIEAGEIVSHDTKHAIVNFADHRGVDTVLAEHEPLRLRSRLLGDPIDWVVRHAPCDVLLVDNHGYDSPEHVAIADDGGPYPPLAVSVAEAIADANGGSVSLWFLADGGATDQRDRTIADYQDELANLLSVPVHAERVRTDGGYPATPDLMVRRGADHRLRSALLDRGGNQPIPKCTTITVYPHESRQPPLLRRLLERAVF
jgi:nucleotide-binding universal stress UspA family protein